MQPRALKFILTAMSRRNNVSRKKTYGSVYGKESKKSRHICVTDSLCCTLQIIQHCKLIATTPPIKIKKKKWVCLYHRWLVAWHNTEHLLKPTQLQEPAYKPLLLGRQGGGRQNCLCQYFKGSSH